MIVIGWAQSSALKGRVVNEMIVMKQGQSKQNAPQWKKNQDLCHGQMLREKKQCKDRVAYHQGVMATMGHRRGHPAEYPYLESKCGMPSTQTSRPAPADDRHRSMGGLSEPGERELASDSIAS